MPISSAPLNRDFPLAVDCERPVQVATGYVSCGRCTVCEAKKRYRWAARIIMEAEVSRGSCFVTLTYDEDHLPLVAYDPHDVGEYGDLEVSPTLVKKDAQDWQKRVRRSFPEHPLRFFTVGEYGSKTQRPHYHAIIFGMYAPEAAEVIPKTWKAGFVDCQPFNDRAAAYVSGYVMKKIGKSSPKLKGREPEFMICSRNPGIGVSYLHKVEAACSSEAGKRWMDLNGEPPRFIEYQGRRYPFDKLMRDKIAAVTGSEYEPVHLIFDENTYRGALLRGASMRKRQRESAAKGL